YDPAKAEVKFGVRVEKGKEFARGAVPNAFGVAGIAGKYLEKFSWKKEDLAEFGANLEGGGFSRDEISICQITEMSGVERDEKRKRFIFAGKFKLEPTGLKDITGTYTTSDLEYFQKTKLTIGGTKNKDAALQLSEISGEVKEDGTLQVPNFNVKLTDFTITR